MLKEKIEKLRRELKDLITNNDMKDSKVIKKSKELDQLIVKYQKMKVEEKN